MANSDVITRLKMETTQYDSKLRDAAQKLKEFGREADKAGADFQKLSKDNMDLAKSFGTIGTSATNNKDKLKELVNAYNDVAKAYNNLTQEQQQSDIGKAMSQSLSQLKDRIKETKTELQSFNNEIKTTQKEGDGFGNVMNGVAGKLGVSTQMFTKAGAAVAAAGLAFKLIGDNIETARNFEVSLSQLSSLTGKTGQDLEQLKDYAIELGSSTTLSASQVADAFKMIGSQQPQLLASSQALKDVTKQAITLSEAAGIDLATAAQSLSTSINQFGGDSNNAARFVNVLAAASQQGAGDIAFLGEAISKSGVLANAVGTSYEELVANLEMLAQAGMDASTAGTALRSIIANLEKQSNDEYKPSVVGLTEAFHNMNEAHLTTVDYLGLAGKQFFSQAMILAENSDKAKELTKSITGTNTAEEQAKTNTDNLDGALKSLASAWEGLNLHLNSSNGLLRGIVDTLKDVVVWVDKALQSLNNYTNSYNNVFSKNSANAPNVDENGNYIKKPVDGNWAHFNANTGEYEPGYGPKAAPPPPAPPSVGGGGGGGKKTGKKTGRKTGSRGTGSHKTTPAEKAEEKVASALLDYSQTITKADLRMEAGLDDTLAHKKKELSAQERLYDAYTDAYAIYANPKYKQNSEDAAAKIKSLSEEVKHMTDAQEAAKKATREQEQAAKKLADAQKKRTELEASWQTSSTGAWSSKAKDIQKQMGTLEAGSADYNKMNAQLADVNSLQNLFNKAVSHGISTSGFDTSGLWAKILNGEDIPDETWQSIADIINEKLKELDLKPIKLDMNTGAVTEAKKVKDGWQDAAKAVQSVGNAMQQLEDPGAKIAGIVGQAIAQIALGFAQATASDSKLGVFGWIAAIAGGLGTMLGTISAIKSATAGSYAEGGIIPGNNHNDGLIAAVSSGELILNRAQQNSIANQLQGGAFSNIQIVGVLEGENIVLAANRVNRRKGKGEYAYTKSR